MAGEKRRAATSGGRREAAAATPRPRSAPPAAPPASSPAPRMTRRSCGRPAEAAPIGEPPWAAAASPPEGKENSPPPSPTLPAVAPRVRRSYSRLDAGTPRGPGGAPLSPIPPNLPPLRLPEPPAEPPLHLPGIGPSGPERRRKKKVAPIDLGELEAWAAQMNAQFEEAERFRLVVE